MPTFLEGSLNTWNCPVFGSSIATVSVSISLAKTRPAASTVTAYGPPFAPAGISYSPMILPAPGSTCASFPLP